MYLLIFHILYTWQLALKSCLCGSCIKYHYGSYRSWQYFGPKIWYFRCIFCGIGILDTFPTKNRDSQAQHDIQNLRSKGDGDLEWAGVAEGVERGDSSAMSQNSSLMSGVDCLLLGCTWTSISVLFIFYHSKYQRHHLLILNAALVEEPLPRWGERVPLYKKSRSFLC